MKNANDVVSPYIAKVKDWKIRQIFWGYFQAMDLFFSTYDAKSGNIPSFSTLRKICDYLYDAKENFHMVFKRVLNPKKQIYEQSNKLTPDESEQMFMNNLGILFHRVMVARELKYLIDHYSVDLEGYADAKNSLEMNLDKLNSMFKVGREVILLLLSKYRNNILLLIYFLENRTMMRRLFKNKYSQVLEILTKERTLEEMHILCAKYYMENGWYKKAASIAKSVLRKNPKSAEAARMIGSIAKIETESIRPKIN